MAKWRRHLHEGLSLTHTVLHRVGLSSSESTGLLSKCFTDTPLNEGAGLEKWFFSILFHPYHSVCVLIDDSLQF